MDVKDLYNRLAAIEKLLSAAKPTLSLEEACAYTGFSKSYMYKLTSAGIIPYSKPNGKTLFFDRSKLDEWMLSNASSSMQEKDTQASTYITSHK